MSSVGYVSIIVLTSKMNLPFAEVISQVATNVIYFFFSEKVGFKHLENTSFKIRSKLYKPFWGRHKTFISQNATKILSIKNMILDRKLSFLGGYQLNKVNYGVM